MWDHAAGYVIMKESNNFISDINGKELDFSIEKNLVNNYGIIACRKEISNEIVSKSKSLYNKC